MVSPKRSRRGASSKSVAIVVVLLIVVMAAGFSVYKSFVSGRDRPTGVEDTESLPEGQFAPAEGLETGGQAGRPQDSTQ